jgi:2-methylisocitrate lyase-like PEP mutase family enzyme
MGSRRLPDSGFRRSTTGGGIARATGVPDLGLLSVTGGRAPAPSSSFRGPVIADADTGYGNALNPAAVQFAPLGVAGLHLEDQRFPKRCVLRRQVAGQ